MRSGTILCILLGMIAVFGCNNDNTVTPPVLVPPTIASITPASGSLGEQLTGTIRGSNFNGATFVSLGDGIIVQGFTVRSSSEIEIQWKVAVQAAGGTRNVTVTTPGGSGTGTNLFEVLDNRIPTARIDVFPANGASNTLYTFEALRSDDSDGTITSYDWEFGDGKKSFGAVVTHRFGVVDTFDVTLTVTDDEGARASIVFELTVQKGEAPDAKFSISPKNGDVNTTYTLDASETQDDGNVREYIWDLGNGKTETGKVVQIRYPDSGLYSILLTVTDNKGLQDSLVKQVTVGEFDQEKAATEIRSKITGFFRLYSNLTGLSAEEIVVDFIEGEPGCNGRAHEIAIVEKQQTFILSNNAFVSGNIDVSFGSSVRAHAITPGHFDWTEADGNHSGDATHDFDMIFKDGEWWICDFVVISSSSPTMMNLFQ